MIGSASVGSLIMQEAHRVREVVGMVYFFLGLAIVVLIGFSIFFFTV